MIESIVLAGGLAVAAGVGLRAIFAKRTASPPSPTFDADDRGRRLANWTPPRNSPRGEVRAVSGSLVARSRDAVRNNPHANRAIRVLTSALVGPGLTPQWETPSPARNVKLAKLWREWAKPMSCDRAGVLSAGAMQAMAVRTMLVSGSVFVRRWWKAGQTVPVRLEVVEPDLLDTSKNSASPLIDHGIELDGDGRPVAYWMLTEHPGNSNIFTTRKMESVRIPATDLLHLYRVDRVGGLGGVPALAPVLARMRQLDEYDVATLQRQQISAAMVGGIIPGDEEIGLDPLALGEDGLPIGRQRAATDVDEAGNPISTIENGVWTLLTGGKAIEFFNPPTPVDAEWKKGGLQAIATGCGLTYMLLTGDLSDANYSSMKQGSGEFWDQIEAERDHTIIPMLLDRMASWFVEGCVAAGHIPDRSVSVSWASRPRPTIDPNKELDAEVSAMTAGLALQPDLLQRHGYDPDQFLRDKVEWVRKMKAADDEIADLTGPPAQPPAEGGTTST